MTALIPKGTKRGRPPKHERSFDCRITLRVPTELAAAWSDQAERAGRCLSDHLRHLIAVGSGSGSGSSPDAGSGRRSPRRGNLTTLAGAGYAALVAHLSHVNAQLNQLSCQESSDHLKEQLASAGDALRALLHIESVVSAIAKKYL